MADQAGFYRYVQVTKYLPATSRVFRSSAPHYQGHDSDQRLDDKSIAFLRSQNIRHVISLNSLATDPAITAKLRDSGIAYTPLPVKDFEPPTLEQLRQGNTAYNRYPTGTLIWCGYGWGRTGTMVTALQIFAEKKKPNPHKFTRQDYDDNHVEKDKQREVLDQLQKEK